MKRLVSFLGTGDYDRVRYDWEGEGAHETEYVAEALAAIARPDEVRLLATDDARARHGDAVSRRITDLGIAVELCHLAAGRDSVEQWQQYGLLQEQLEIGDRAELLLDITHGFRAQPFMAGAALAVHRALAPQANPARIVYGERTDSGGRIWNLDLFTEWMDWALALGLVLRTGVAGPLVELARRERRRQGVAARHSGDFPRFRGVVEAIDAFAADLATVRVASLVTGHEQDDARKPAARSMAKALVEAIDAHRAEVHERVPPLAAALDRLRDAADRLHAPRLHGDEGRDALLALARHYLALERYPEAAIVARETAVNDHALGARAVEVNSAQFRDASRQEADHLFSTRDPRARDVARVRNDIGHGGFRAQPLGAASLRRHVEEMVERLADPSIGAPPAPAPSRTLFVSRHPGAREWACAEGLAVDAVVDHLAIDEIAPGDTVIGSLPVNLAAEVCARGARYFHLAIELPADLRGEELSDEMLRALGARLVEFRVRALDG